MSNKFMVLAIIVTYYPNAEQLAKTLTSLRGQVNGIALIDNTPGGFPSEAAQIVSKHRSESDYGLFFVVENNDNLGIAAAQNIGIELARENNFGYVLLSDQDTEFAAGTVDCLCKGYRHLIADGKKIGAVAAGYVNQIDSAKARPVFVQHEGYRVRRIRADAGLVPATYVIASGCLIPVGVFEQVGVKDASLFIDWVDTEWCLRARRAGYEIYGSADAVIAHHLGDDVARVMGRAVTLHSPIRHYYMVRNAIRLAFYSKAPNAYQRIRIGASAILYSGFFPVFCKPHLAHVRMVGKGLVDGLLNKGGRIGGK